MQFFLYEILARVVAIYLLIDSGRQLRRGLIERKIKNISSDFLDWLFDWWSPRVFYRDVTPVRYWMTLGSHVAAMAACRVVAIAGWWRPGA